MFNKKKKRIEELLRIVSYKNAIINKQINRINDLETVNNAFAKTIDKQAGEIDALNKKIKELEACFKPQVTMCEETTKTTKKTPKKTSKTVKKG